MPYESPNKAVHVRMSPEERQELYATATAQGSNASEVIRELVAVWMGKPGARMPDGPWSEVSDPLSEAVAPRSAASA